MVFGYEDYAGPSYGHYSTGTEEELNKKVNQGEAEHLIHMYKWLRDVSMDIRTSIAEGDLHVLLKYLGLQGMVYTCMLPPAAASGGKNSFSVDEELRHRVCCPRSLAETQCRRLGRYAGYHGLW